MEYFNQDKKMSDIDKSYPFHSLIVPEDHVVYYLKSLSRSVTQACKLEKRRAAVFHVLPSPWNQAQSIQFWVAVFFEISQIVHTCK